MTQKIKITSNIGQKLVSMVKHNRLLDSKVLVRAWHTILDLTGQTSVADYWITGVDRLSPTHPTKPTQRSGRLIGSLIGARRFTAVRAPTDLEEALGTPVQSSGEGFAGGKKESIRRVKATAGQITAAIGSEVEYAEGLEFTLRSYLRPAAEVVIKEGLAEKVLLRAVEANFERAAI